MEEKVYEVSLGQLFRVALKHWWIILIAVVLGAVIAFGYVTLFVTPTYTSHAKLGLSITYTQGGMNDYQQTLMGNQIAKDAADIIVSNITRDRAVEKLEAYSFAENNGKPYRNYTSEGLLTMIKTTTSDDSRYFVIEVTSDSPDEAKLVCDIMKESFFEVLAENEYIREAEGKTIEYPEVPKYPSSPNRMLSIVLGALIGFVLSFGVLLVIHFAKDALDGEDWLIEVYNEKIPMLAVIPDANSSGKSYRKYSKKYGYGYGYPQK